MKILDATTVLAQGLAFPEGPLDIGGGEVAFVEMAADRVAVLDRDSGGLRSVPCADGPNGLAVGRHPREVLVCLNGGLTFTKDADGRLTPGHAVDRHARGGIAYLHLDSGARELLIAPGPDSPVSGPNDAVIAPPGSPSAGGFFFTDLGRQLRTRVEPGGVFWCGLDGSGLTTVAYPRPGRPNGIGLSPDGKTLYVSESRSARVWAWDVLGPGALGHAWLVHEFPRPTRLDGLTVTARGNLVCTNLVVGQLTVLSPAGQILHVLTVEDPYPTNVIIEAGRGDYLLVTLGSTGRIVRLHVPELAPL
ncbi:MAG: SMP-30/gluconolactonase/LRE family protein [Ornithinimicrobium sp.]|uniref:SMP-30/gluconolactonase/LRE family protein n=1 Tax=Ornithinimicrobium sp. TaxID=1977084 RepID=UPI0026E0674F|nr:SMP-30/gluconolactonase/LRE family protein [Ornithinimicrobium sp.]MDO5739988.1 SMP-30/gluconolactonase/LRE family protein [Ornithinimicrobium sp.]